MTSQEIPLQTNYSRGERLSGYMSNECSQLTMHSKVKLKQFPASVPFGCNSGMPALVKKIRYLKYSM